MNYLFEIERVVTELLTNELPQHLLYHNYCHTREVVRAARRIGSESGLSTRELQIVQMAAWLHDVGHIHSYWNHEEAGILIAFKVLYDLGFPMDDTALILGCIQATKMPQQPQNLLEMVVCDADLAHLAADNFRQRSDLLREEWTRVLNKSYSDRDWHAINIRFMKKQCYFTPFGRKVLLERQRYNLSSLFAESLV